MSHKWEQWRLSRSSHHAISIFSIQPFFFSVTSHCRKRLFCGALVISLCHLMVESWVGLNSVLEMNWSSTCVTRKLLPPLSTDLAACPSMESPYCVSAIRYPSNKRARTHTHIVYVTHILCIFSLTHTTHKNAITEACPPNPYTLIPIAESALCIHWLAGQLLERESKTGGRGKMETARHRNIRKRSRQIEKKEKLILGGDIRDRS